MTTLNTPAPRSTAAPSATAPAARRRLGLQTRIVLKLALAALLSFVLLVFSSSKVDFVYTGF